MNYINLSINENDWIDFNTEKPDPKINEIIWIKCENQKTYLISLIAKKDETLSDNFFPIIYNTEENKLQKVETSVKSNILMWQKTIIRQWQ